MRNEVTKKVFEKMGMSLSVYASRNSLRIHSLYRGIVNADAAKAFERDGIDIKQTTAQRKSNEKGQCCTAC